MRTLGDEMFFVEDLGETVLLSAWWPTELDQAEAVQLRNWLDGWLNEAAGE